MSRSISSENIPSTALGNREISEEQDQELHLNDEEVVN